MEPVSVDASISRMGTLGAGHPAAASQEEPVDDPVDDPEAVDDVPDDVEAPEAGFDAGVEEEDERRESVR